MRSPAPGPTAPSGAGDLAAGRAVGVVELQIDGGAGAIVLAHGVDARGLPAAGRDSAPGLRRERRAGRGAWSSSPACIRGRYTGSPPISVSGMGCGCARKRPVVSLDRPLGVGAAARPRPVGTMSTGTSAAHRLADDPAPGDRRHGRRGRGRHHEALVAQRAHHGQAVRGHRALGIDDVLGIAARAPSSRRSRADRGSPA